MECKIKYRPIIDRTHENDRKAIKAAYLNGNGICPACSRDGLNTPIEERFGETT